MATVVEPRRASLGGSLGDVARVRHSVGDWLRGWGLPGLVEDVELLASELATNAILHAGGEIDLVLERCGGGVRVLVRDGRPDLVPARRTSPLPRRAEESLDELARKVFEGTTTGRGLLLVEAFADAWGVDLAPGCKEVWAELGTGRPASAGNAAPPPPGGAGTPVRLKAVPVRLVLLSAANLDDLVRELQTTDFDAPDASELAALGGRLVHETLGQREPLRFAARAALQEQVRRVDVDLEVPPAKVAVLRRFVALTEEVERFCRSGVLLSEPPTSEITAFRHWYVDELDRQVSGDPATPCPFPE